MNEVVKFEKILVQIKGAIVDITDLPKPAYEHFLEITHHLRQAYIVINNNKK